MCECVFLFYFFFIIIVHWYIIIVIMRTSIYELILLIIKGRVARVLILKLMDQVNQTIQNFNFYQLINLKCILPKYKVIIDGMEYGQLPTSRN